MNIIKTAIICFEGGNNYTKEKQIKSILREEIDSMAISCKDYDELDTLMPILKESYGIKNVILLHEDKNLDRFEIAAKQEYNHLFEKIEIYPEGFIRLQEVNFGTGTAAQQGAMQKAGVQGGTAQKGEQGDDLKNIYLFPVNPPIKGAKPPSKPYAADSMTLVSTCLLDCDQNGFWSTSAVALWSLKKEGQSWAKEKKYAFSRTLNGLLRLYGRQDLGQIQVYAAQNMWSKWAQNAPQPATQIQYLDPNFNLPNELGVQAFKIGKDIISKPAKPDKGLIEFWEDDKRIHLAGFLIKALGDIQQAVTLGNKENETKDGNSLVNTILDKFGVYKDLATAAKNLRTGGLSLVVDAAEIITKELSKKKERKEKKSDAFISNPKLKDFANCFTDDIDNKSGEFVEGN